MRPIDGELRWQVEKWRLGLSSRIGEKILREPLHRRALLALAAGLAFGCGRAEAAEDEPLPVEEIADGVFVYRAPYELATPGNLDMIGNCGFVIGEDGVAVIDSGGSYRGG